MWAIMEFFGGLFEPFFHFVEEFFSRKKGICDGIFFF
jgi:hypothetical protein